LYNDPFVEGSFLDFHFLAALEEEPNWDLDTNELYNHIYELIFRVLMMNLGFAGNISFLGYTRGRVGFRRSIGKAMKIWRRRSL
jgi:hypothetical protein